MFSQLDLELLPPALAGWDCHGGSLHGWSLWPPWTPEEGTAEAQCFQQQGRGWVAGCGPPLGDCKVIFMIFPIPIFVSHLFPIYIYKYIILYDKYFVPLLFWFPYDFRWPLRSSSTTQRTERTWTRFGGPAATTTRRNRSGRWEMRIGRSEPLAWTRNPRVDTLSSSFALGRKWPLTALTEVTTQVTALELHACTIWYAWSLLP